MILCGIEKAIDRIGLYKLKKAFNGYVSKIGGEIKHNYRMVAV
ncbi:MAG: hypothetical protein N4A57_18265 [Anaeromicrobium sp.]|jgi:lipid II:glycine glycyltransferase (peptidoglycan interpeptide bridge formation enzyme)|nr:hypothetical protein [Anaeromicrobium sp.]